MYFVAIITAIMLYEVIMRYVFARPTIWVKELSRWLGGIIFLVAGQIRSCTCVSLVRHSVLHQYASQLSQPTVWTGRVLVKNSSARRHLFSGYIQRLFAVYWHSTDGSSRHDDFP